MFGKSIGECWVNIRRVKKCLKTFEGNLGNRSGVIARTLSPALTRACVNPWSAPPKRLNAFSKVCMREHTHKGTTRRSSLCALECLEWKRRRSAVQQNTTTAHTLGEVN